MAVIIDALAGRDGVSDAARRELSTRIRKLRIKGFRAANRTPHDRLVETVLDAIADGDHGLAAAIVATWMQTRSALRERAAEHPAGTRHRRGRCAARSVHQLLGHRRVAARTQPDASGPRRRPCAPRRCRADAEPGVRPAFPVPRRSNPSSSRPGSTRCGSCPRQRPNGPPTRPTWASGSATSCKRRNASSSKASSTRSPASGTGWRIHYRHGRANRAVAGEAVRDWAIRRLLVARLRLETARPAAQPADPWQGGPGESFAA